MSSMDWPFSSFFSISTMSFTPSTTSCTCSTSDEPSRSALDMSNTEPTAAVSTPPVGAGARGMRKGQLCVWAGSRARVTCDRRVYSMPTRDRASLMSVYVGPKCPALGTSSLHQPT
uniref:Uncharacterized protein n=2 Tax=Euteleostomi TaxID=117571 RepID=A0A8D2DJT9_SCIVU